MPAAKKKAAPKSKAKKVVKKAPEKKAVAKKASAKKKTVAKKASAAPKAIKAISTKQTQAQAIAHLAESTGLEKKQVKAVFAATRDLIEAHVKPRGSGDFSIPELGIKVKRHEKPATKARMGVNPFTGEKMKFAAKPKRKVVKVTAMKKIKEILA